MFRVLKMQERTITNIKEGLWCNDRQIRFEWRNDHKTNESGDKFDNQFQEIKSLGKDE